jgi:hypothetical protein
MRKNKKMLAGLILIIFSALLVGCAGMSKPNQDNFQAPEISLLRVEVTYYTGYYYFSSGVEPTRGQAGNYGAPMQLSFIYEISNPNVYPVMIDGFTFTVLFEDFEVNTVSSPEAMWIPAGKTNQLRVPATFDARQTFVNLQLPGALKLKQKKLTAWEVLEKWWTQAPDFSYQISAHQGSAVFRADGITVVVPFSATFP